MARKNKFSCIAEAPPTFASRQSSATRAENKIYFDFPETQPILAAGNVVQPERNSKKKEIILHCRGAAYLARN